MIKPRFEAGMGKGGIVRDETVRNKILENITAFFKESGFENIQTKTSPITGADGNVEFLIYDTVNS